MEKVNKQYFEDTRDVKEALKIHGLAFEYDGCSTGSESGKSDFDEEYFKYKPQPVKIRSNKIVIIRPAPNVTNVKNTFSSKNDEEKGEVQKAVAVKVHNNYRRIAGTKPYPKGNINNVKQEEVDNVKSSGFITNNSVTKTHTLSSLHSTYVQNVSHSSTTSNSFKNVCEEKSSTLTKVFPTFESYNMQRSNSNNFLSKMHSSTHKSLEYSYKDNSEPFSLKKDIEYDTPVASPKMEKNSSFVQKSAQLEQIVQPLKFGSYCDIPTVFCRPRVVSTNEKNSDHSSSKVYSKHVHKSSYPCSTFEENEGKEEATTSNKSNASKNYNLLRASNEGKLYHLPSPSTESVKTDRNLQKHNNMNSNSSGVIDQPPLINVQRTPELGSDIIRENEYSEENLLIGDGGENMFSLCLNCCIPCRK